MFNLGQRFDQSLVKTTFPGSLQSLILGEATKGACLNASVVSRLLYMQDSGR